MEHAVDVLIVGGAFVGGTLASALGQAGVTAAVVDTADPAAQAAPDYDGRASSLAVTSKKLLDGVGLWAPIADNTNPIEDIRVTDNRSPLFLHYDHREVGDEPFGYMVENQDIRRAVQTRLPGLSDTVTVLAPERITAFERDAAGVRAWLAGGDTVRARVIVGCDGRPSATRRAAGIPITRWDYGQTGIVLTVRHEIPHDNVAQERFLPAGPFAILPLKGNRSCIVWTERTETAPLITNLDSDAFHKELERRFGRYLGDLAVESPVWSYPVSIQFTRQFVSRRLALAGDAAHGMHYIAGQGMNMGLRDAAALAEVLVDARRLGLDVGDSSVLERYQRWRRFDTMLMLALTDNLNRLFSNSIPPVKLARDLGLGVVDKLPPLKRTFMRHAMGQAGDLPRLMRGHGL